MTALLIDGAHRKQAEGAAPGRIFSCSSRASVSPTRFPSTARHDETSRSFPIGPLDHLSFEPVAAYPLTPSSSDRASKLTAFNPSRRRSDPCALDASQNGFFGGGDPDQRASDALPTGAFIEGGLRLPCVRSLCCLTCTIVRGWASPRQIAMDGTRYYITRVPRWEVAAFPPAAPISCESPGRCGPLNSETAGRNVEDRSRAA